MRYFIAICLVLLLFAEIRCKKTSIHINQLAGKWNIVNDSSSTNNSCNNCFNGSNYLGRKSDYYNFTDDGTLYIEERDAIDTATYSIITDNRVNIATNYAVNGSGVFIYSLGLTGFNLPLSYSIKNLGYSISNITEHTLTLTTSGTVSLTGLGAAPIKYIEIINLKR